MNEFENKVDKRNDALDSGAGFLFHSDFLQQCLLLQLS